MSESPEQIEALERRLLDGGWTRARLREGLLLARAVEDDPRLGRALDDFETIRERLAPTGDIGDVNDEALTRLVHAVSYAAERDAAVASAPRRADGPRSRRLAAAAMLVAAGLLIVLVVDRPSPDPSPKPTPEVVSFDSANLPQIARQIEAFGEIDKSLGGRAGMLAFTSGGEIEVTTLPPGGGGARATGHRHERVPSSGSLVLRRDGDVVGQIDFVGRGRSPVEVACDLSGGGTVSVEAVFDDQEGRWSLWVRLSRAPRSDGLHGAWLGFESSSATRPVVAGKLDDVTIEWRSVTDTRGDGGAA